MNGYVLTVVGTVLISAVLTMLVPEGKSTAIIKGITKLVCLIVLIAPIPKLLGDEDFFDAIRGETAENAGGFFKDSGINADEQFIKYYCELRVKETETALEEEILDAFDVSVNVEFDWQFTDETDIDQLKITRIKIQTKQETNEEVKRKMCAYVTDNYCSEVLIE